MASEDIIKKIFRLYPWIFFLSFLIFVIIHFFYSNLSPNFIGERKIFYVEPGIKIWQLGHNLEKEKIIKSAFYFRLLTNLKKSKIKAGIYEFNGFYNLLDVINILEKGGRGIKIVITEGLTLKEIENLFKEKGFEVNFDKFSLLDFPEINLQNYFPQKVNLEGFLAPDTYEFFPSDSEKKIVQTILKNFSKKYLTEIFKKTDFTPYETLILASIIEKEVKNKEDFPIVAGLLIKRLKNNWRLETDATLVYEKCNYLYCSKPLTKEDLKNNSSFNTYKNYGLPPQPISNPGLYAVKAVVEPIDTEYWFYLHDFEGNTIFAKTLKEHNQNIKKYLK